jgi:hypothetical protein
MAQRKLTEQEMHYNFNRYSLAWRNVTKILGNIVRWGAICFCVYWFMDSIKAFAGKETDANILMDIILSLRANHWIGFVFGGGGLVYGGIRNKQLKNTRETMGDHIRKLEKEIDPNRQNSRLNKYGETHEDDR